MEAELQREIERLRAIVEALNDRIVRGQLKEEQILNEFSSMNNEMVTLQRKLAKSNAELEEAVKEAERANEAKNQFLAMISHEFRTPMNGILGMTELLRGSALGEEQRSWTGLIEESAESLLGMVSDLLDLSKSEAGMLDIEEKTFDLREVVTHAVQLLQPRAGAKCNRIECDIDASVASSLKGDPTRIRQILINLINNANTFTENGTIRVTVRPASSGSDLLSFEVRDSGIGISQPNIEKLFKPYSQTEAGKAKAGTGLGLMICKSLVEAMQGEIGVVSREGEGSTFWFRLALPAASVPTHEGSSASLRAVPVFGAPGGEIPILVAEDNPINSRVIRMQLKKLGLDAVEVVGDGKEAVAAFLSRPYAVILMDKHMPVMDGPEAARRIRELERDEMRRPIPIIALTGDSLESEKEVCRKAGMNDFLGKPVSMEALGSMLQKWLPRASDKALDSQVVREIIELDEGEEPEIFRALLETYEEETPGKLERLERFVLEGDCIKGMRAAHDLKSGSLSIGVHYFANLLETIEHALKDGDTDTARDVLPKLNGAYEAAREELHRFA
ncbi:ATP-binding protein [Saccharibacillus alkalitolerans]|uniref:histidine kinase n=1 Tax=Saccharibacillus alkalitolerans TaxID=2705290 RepID=A0ABX0FBZ8_9BACL|nr:ATP-binding protein [Saccharibacillus alkalitolerans]NGZ75567.1 response regulator [Saccharibacillus alkalitolerans]